MSNFKELYKVYQRHGPQIWAAGNEQAAETISLPGEEPESRYYSPGQKRKPRPQANVLHLVASFNGADKIKQLSDIGSMLALWVIEETCFWVMEDKSENEQEPESAQYADLWSEVPEMETMHRQFHYDEAVLNKINNLLGGN